jgi:hypothetical protein
MITPGIFLSGAVREKIKKVRARNMSVSFPIPPDQKCILGKNKIKGNNFIPKISGLRLRVLCMVRNKRINPIKPSNEKSKLPVQNESPNK